MSYYNGSLPVSDYWSGYAAQAQLPSTPRLALLALLNIPVFAILLNVIWQLVRSTTLFWQVNSI
jgi:sterol 14-demethylase